MVFIENCAIHLTEQSYCIKVMDHRWTPYSPFFMLGVMTMYDAGVKVTHIRCLQF